MRILSTPRIVTQARKYWNQGNNSISKAFNNILQGEIQSVTSKEVKGNHCVLLIIIYKPKVEIGDEHISLIADGLGGSLTQGSIIYQKDHAIITWSNLDIIEY